MTLDRMPSLTGHMVRWW